MRPSPLSKATILGTGAMATVTAQILAVGGAQVAMLARDDARVQELVVARENQRYLPGLRLSERIAPTTNAARAFAHSELIISAAPCQYLRATLGRLAGSIPFGVPICSVTKGIEVATLLRPSEIICEFAPQNPFAVLSGPNIAPELARCLPATAVVAAEDRAMAELVQSALSTSWLRIYTSADVVGVELAGALKNVIALAAGILDGLHAGDNAKAALVTRGLVEMTRLGAALGARQDTFAGLAGVGDLITTCVSPIGRNRSAGELIGAGRPVDEVIRSTSHVIEGIPTTQAVMRLAERLNVEMPITRAVHDVIMDGKLPLVAITELMNRPPKPEH